MSTYNGDLTWEDNSNRAGRAARGLLAALSTGVELYNEWQSFRGGRTNAQIATALSRTEAEIADLDSCFAACLTVHSFTNNGAEPQGDYDFALRKFS